MVLLNVLVSLASLSVTLIMCKKKKKDLNGSKRVLVNQNVKKCDHSVADSNKNTNRYEKTSRPMVPSQKHLKTSEKPSRLEERKEETNQKPSVKVSSTPVSQTIPPSPEKSLKTSKKPLRVEDWDDEDFQKELLAYKQEVRKIWAKEAPWLLEIEKELDTESINQEPSKSTEKPQSTVKPDKTTTDKPKDTVKSTERAKSKTKKAKGSLKDSKRSKDQKKLEKVEKEEEIRVKLMDDPPGENEEEQSATRLSELYSGQLKLTN